MLISGFTSPILNFSKYHGLGNDFILMDDPDGQIQKSLSADRIRALCHRQTGIGGDGILVRTASSHADHRMLLFNADGTPAEISGNGLRCFVLFLKECGYPVDRELTIETGGGIQRARANEFPPAMGGGAGEGVVESTMPRPEFSAGGNVLTLTEKDLNFTVIPVSVGNPHGVIFGPERDIPFAEKYGPGLEKNPAFPAGANIEFVHVLDNRSCQLVVWERGVGITLACGSGSVATACAGAHAGHFAFDQPIAVHQPGGTLHITVGKNFSEIRQRGPAAFVFKGEIDL